MPNVPRIYKYRYSNYRYAKRTLSLQHIDTIENRIKLWRGFNRPFTMYMYVWKNVIFASIGYRIWDVLLVQAMYFIQRWLYLIHYWPQVLYIFTRWTWDEIPVFNTEWWKKWMILIKDLAYTWTMNMFERLKFLRLWPFKPYGRLQHGRNKKRLIYALLNTMYQFIL
jgi:hypothetical protein